MAVATHGNRTTIIRNIGESGTIPGTLVCHLKYYVHTVCSLLHIDEDSIAYQLLGLPRQRMTALKNFFSVEIPTDEELEATLMLCLAFSPDELIGKVFIQDDGLCGSQHNKFVALDTLESNIAVSESAVIAGRRLTVTEIMAFKPIWLVKCWIAPMRFCFPNDDAVEEKIRTLRQMVPPIILLESVISFKSRSDPSIPPYRPPSSTCCIIL